MPNQRISLTKFTDVQYKDYVLCFEIVYSQCEYFFYRNENCSIVLEEINLFSVKRKGNDRYENLNKFPMDLVAEFEAQVPVIDEDDIFNMEIDHG